MNIKTKIAGALMLAVLIVPGISFAQNQTQSTADLQALIAGLMAQVQQLQAQLAAQGGGTITAAWCHAFNNNLSIGMTGSEVTALQTALQKDGESVSLNGSYDDQTASAVTGFQQKYTSNILAPYGLTNGTGYVGAATRAKLNALFGCNSQPPITVCPVWGCNGPTPIPTPITINPSSAIGSITAVQDSSNPPAQQLVMGTTGNVLAVYRFSETTGVEGVKINSLTFIDSNAAYNGGKPTFTNVSIYTGANLVGTASAASVSSNGYDYVYTVNFSTPVVILAGSSMSLTLRGDVNSYQSGGVTDLSSHLFDVTGGSGIGMKSNAAIPFVSPSSCTIMASTNACASGNGITVYRSTIAVSAASLGVSSGRTSAGADNFGTLTFTANSAGSITLNTVTVTLSGTAVPQLSNAVTLYDPATGSVLNGSLAYNGNVSSETMTFSPNAVIIAGTSKAYTLQINSKAFTGGSTLTASIKDVSGVTFTDAMDANAKSGLFLPASAVPVAINTAAYGASQTNPTITVLAPNGGTLTSGTIYNIKYTSTYPANNEPETGVALYQGNTLIGYPVYSYVSPDVLAWNVGQYTVSGSGVPQSAPSGSNYYIKVYMAGGAQGMSSAPFNIITATTPMPVINNINPTHGGVGSTITIFGTNLSGAFNVGFYNSDPSFAPGIVPSYATATSVTFTISNTFAANVAPGTYQIDVQTPPCSTPAGCISNKISFTLDAPVTPPSAPVVTVLANPTTITLGQSSTITWSATNAVVCSPAGSWFGATNLPTGSPSLGNVAGSVFVTPSSAGTFTYNVYCGNSNGLSTNGSATLTVTAPATVTSYNGTLNVSLDSSTPAPTVIAPGDNSIVFANLRLAAVGGNVNAQWFSVVSNSANAVSGLSNIRIFNGSTLLGTASKLQAFPSVPGGYVNVPESIPVTLASGSSVVLTLVADVSPSATGIVNLGIGGGGGNYATMSPNYSVYGNNMTISTVGAAG